MDLILDLLYIVHHYFCRLLKFHSTILLAGKEKISFKFKQDKIKCT